MTRTARKKATEPFPATSWEELRIQRPSLGQNEKGKKHDLKVTQQQKLGPDLSEKAKKTIRKVTGKRLRRSLSDIGALLEFDEHVSMPKNVANRRAQDSSKSKTHSKKKERLDIVSELDEMRTIETSMRLKKHKKRNLMSNLKSRRNKKRRTTSEDRVPLPHSESDSSLSDEGEKGGSGDCEERESGGDVGAVDVGGCDGEGVEGDVSAKVTSKKRRGNKKATSRVRVGKHWVKAGSGQSSAGQTVSDVAEEGGGVTRVRKRGIDEDRRKKRIEHRRLRRQRKKVCFSCRQPGHWVGDCPLNSTSSGICFKCGSSEHTCQQCRVEVPPGEFPYAKCFICGEAGHLSRSCPDNPRGLYPRGGGCKICGSVEHLKANCPTETKPCSKQSVPRGSAVHKIDVITSADALDVTEAASPPVKRIKTGRRKEKLVKF